MSTPLERFRRSLQIGLEEWRDGIGYDVAALREATGEERAAIESMLLARGVNDWRDVEALAELGTERARAAVEGAAAHADPTVRAAVARYAPELAEARQRGELLAQAIRTAEFFHGLGEAIDEAAEFHPPVVVEALLAAALAREGPVAVHCAALLTYIHGHAEDPFDMEQRPFFLRFDTADAGERRAVFAELCARIGVDGARFLGA